jgi:uncharacterized protein YndB with AHSA1/START domain
MVHYQFETELVLTAPIEEIFETVRHVERYHEWWPSVRRSELVAAGNESGIGHHTSHVIRGPLGYRMRFDLKAIEMEHPRHARYLVRGDLIGTATYLLEPTDEGTLVRLLWNVSTTKRWMAMLGPITRSTFLWSHSAVMREGAKAMAALLDGDLLRVGTSVSASSRRDSVASVDGVEAG